MTVLQQWFAELDAILAQTRHYWQILPFDQQTLPWGDNVPLLAALNGLDEVQIEQLDADDKALRQFLQPFIPAMTKLDALLSLPLHSPEFSDTPSWLKAGIKGRKWQQIQTFAALLDKDELPVLEWCAGKGHLGRLIAFSHGRRVESVEWQQSLCDAGQQGADKWDLPQQFYQADVLQGEAAELIKMNQQVVALHACGELHMSLLRQASARQSQKLLVSPCCYHLITDDVYHPLSAAARDSVLCLDKRDLNLPLQQTVVAGERERRFRTTEVTWRLGFDELQRDIRQQQQYLPLPSVRQSMLTGDFETFCRWAAERKGLVLPPQVDWQEYEMAGQRRKQINGRIELVCHGFRQALEIWLLLDRALFLEEQGYEVALSQFCDPQVTPRNLLITAERRAPAD